MNREQVIERLCELVSKVGREVHHSEISHDCFCDERNKDDYPIVHSNVIEFIECVIENELIRPTISRTTRIPVVRMIERKQANVE